MINEFNHSHLDAIMDIWLETNIKTHHYVSEDYWRGHYDSVKEILPHAAVFIYEEGGIIKGFAGILQEEELNYLAGLFVKEEYQGAGIGRKLLDYCKTKFDTIGLHVFEKNRRAVDFYLRNGFQIADDRMDEKGINREYKMVWANNK